jgi:hypothetical protein
VFCESTQDGRPSLGFTHAADEYTARRQELLLRALIRRTPILTSTHGCEIEESYFNSFAQELGAEIRSGHSKSDHLFPPPGMSSGSWPDIWNLRYCQLDRVEQDRWNRSQAGIRVADGEERSSHLSSRRDHTAQSMSRDLPGRS